MDYRLMYNIKLYVFRKNKRQYLDLGLGNGFLDLTPKTHVIEEKIDKLDLFKIKNFCSQKDAVKRMKRQARDWEEISEHV